MSSLDVSYNLVAKEEVPDATEIELAGFHPDEAASRESLEYRQAHAPDLFLGAYIPESPPSAHSGNPLSTRKLIGYVVATMSSSPTVTEASMKEHIPVSKGGITVVIHSVCVHPDYQKKGVAIDLLREYLARLEKDAPPEVKSVHLICHEELLELYRKAGFELVGKSPVVHGPREWFEMKYDLPSKADAAQRQLEIPTEALAALLKPSSTRGSAPAPRRFTSFPSIQDLVTDDSSTGGQSNRYKIVCPREGCRSVILLPGVAKLVEAAAVELDSPKDPPPPNVLAPLPSPPETMEWWLVTPNPMRFENIGFSKSVNTPGGILKMLSCADCDLGPLGYSEIRSTEFWVACSRVAYRE
ncbi:hypothetical protein M407DRAFT_241840 [Tulasnella calospora MUT 4182]|uniref:N-acetyltransferase domain-containing protein n=1 Tax=Tulasnella calospora MUT 4182 TaxID=1051891 RepID=A0A0C3QRF6_9AGAM|nr:hypothetical protein M407DRAFT_241840 [Tulasnella calospora MUT 4182]